MRGRSLLVYMVARPSRLPPQHPRGGFPDGRNEPVKERGCTMTRKTALAVGRSALTRQRIRTTADLDKWIRRHPMRDGNLMSRFKALSQLTGPDASIWILNDLAIEVCT